MALVTGQVGGLWQALATVPDHRRSEGKRYPLASLLPIAIAALLSGRRDQLGIVRWGRRLSREALEAIGIGRNRVPAPSVWSELFQGLNIVALKRARGGWVLGEQPAGHVAIDGKRLRGSATAQSPQVHLLAAFSATLQGVTGQMRLAPGHRPKHGGQAALRNGRRAQRSATAWSRSSVPFTTKVRTFSIKCAPLGDQRICCWAFIRRCSSHCTVLSATAVEIGSSRRRPVA